MESIPVTAEIKIKEAARIDERCSTLTGSEIVESIARVVREAPLGLGHLVNLVDAQRLLITWMLTTEALHKAEDTLSVIRDELRSIDRERRLCGDGPDKCHARAWEHKRHALQVAVGQLQHARACHREVFALVSGVPADS